MAFVPADFISHGNGPLAWAEINAQSRRNRTRCDCPTAAPDSSRNALVAAFAGRELIMRAYQEAIAQQYRFYSYGDACLIE